MNRTRKLSTGFIEDLTEAKGKLRGILDLVQADPTLDLQIRDQAINIYYRGGSLMKIGVQGAKEYKVKFDPQYAKGLPSPAPSTPRIIVSACDTKLWVNAVPSLKHTMDLWFGKHPKDERAMQQMIVWENNCSPWANDTDWFITDIEYANNKLVDSGSGKKDGTRFDLIGIRWDSTPSARKLAKKYRPRLTFFELKTGDGAISNTSGMVDHLRKLKRFLSNKERVEKLKEETLDVLRQKRDWGLIKPLKSNPNSIESLADETEVVFLLAAHKPASTKLKTELEQIRDAKLDVIEGVPIKFCVANFMGYGLYARNMFALDDFVERCL